MQRALLMLAVATAMPLASAFSPGFGARSTFSLGGTRLSLSASAVKAQGSLPQLRRGVRREARVQGLRMQQDPESDVVKNAIRETTIAVGAATAFGAGIGGFMGVDKAVEYFTGYILEESLSVDNLFVFLLLFEYFKVPAEEQKKVLKYGIWGAIAMRAIFIGAGILAIEKFRGVLVGFAAILIYSSYKILSTVGEEKNEEEDLSENQIVKFVNRFVTSTPEYDGDKFFTTVDGVKMATPLLVVLICVELSDVIFAVDSIPAVFGVTEDPFIVFTSNVFAIASLRALYQVLAKLAKDLEYLDTAVGAVLGFIGVKLVAEYAGYEVSELASLGVVAALLGVGVGTSLQKKKGDDRKMESAKQEQREMAEKN